MKFAFATAAVAFAALIGSVIGESHTVHFDNRCGYGTPTLIQGPNVLSTGADYTSNGPLIAAIAYLQTGNCGFNGDGCTLIETTLENVAPGNGGSSSDISLIPPHQFSVTSGFGYYNGCDGAGADCTYQGCPTAFYHPDDTWVQVACRDDNVNLVITFCA
ncbi:hypothetical protein GSI_05587 [Ganoderma sinense ZZ0214-1]|uniref:Glycopeptide n=1 Tax=Ganoderma sinense ZZ0214-1 TaxID=1077348 RepID=A0A2G8SF15_9APHY|nr:hypothetical protein GSI_05587 [Ganoderma sinense ZZ0214-1]